MLFWLNVEVADSAGATHTSRNRHSAPAREKASSRSVSRIKTLYNTLLNA